MEQQRERTFKAIVAFIQDLDTGFGKRYKPVALYYRLISRTTLEDATAIDRHINAMRTFFTNNQNYIRDRTLVGDARILYSERIYLDIGRILSKTDSDDHKVIHQHLITIYSLMYAGTKAGQEALERLKTNDPQMFENLPDLNIPDTAAGDFVKESLTDLQNCFTGMETNPESMPNPVEMIQTVLQSGVFTKMATNLQDKLSTGKMTPAGLFGTVQSVMTSAIPAGEEDNASNFMKQGLGALGGMGLSGDALPPEMEQQMQQLFSKPPPEISRNDNPEIPRPETPDIPSGSE
jgi:hypothetical protein